MKGKVFIYKDLCDKIEMTIMNFVGMMNYYNDGFFMPGFLAFGFTMGILFLVFWVWMIVDCVKRKFKSDNEKIVWILIILFAKIIGALIYFFVVKNRKK